MTEVDKLSKYLATNGFMVGKVLSSRALVNQFYLTNDGDKVVIESVHVSVFEGSNTKEGELGCVSYGFHGRFRGRRCRTTSTSRILGNSMCPNSADEFIKVFEEWQRETIKTISKWRKLI